MHIEGLIVDTGYKQSSGQLYGKQDMYANWNFAFSTQLCLVSSQVEKHAVNSRLEIRLCNELPCLDVIVLSCTRQAMHNGALMILLRCAAGAARKTHMAWNWVELQQLLLASPCVRLVLSGHDHMGGYAQHGHVHFVTVEAMLEGKLWYAVHVVNMWWLPCTKDCLVPAWQVPCTNTWQLLVLVVLAVHQATLLHPLYRGGIDSSPTKMSARRPCRRIFDV